MSVRAREVREKTAARQSVGSSYWSLLNFFGPAGLLKVRKRVKRSDGTRARTTSGVTGVILTNPETLRVSSLMLYQLLFLQETQKQTFNLHRHLLHT